MSVKFRPFFSGLIVLNHQFYYWLHTWWHYCINRLDIDLHYSGVLWVSWRLKLTASQVSVQQIYGDYIKENIKVHITDPLWGKSTGDRWFTLTKGQKRGNPFRVMTSSRVCQGTVMPVCEFFIHSFKDIIPIQRWHFKRLRLKSLYALLEWSPEVQLNKQPGAWFNIKMLSYQYGKSHCGDKTILRPSYLHNRISYTGEKASLYWNRTQWDSPITTLANLFIVHMNEDGSYCQVSSHQNFQLTISESHLDHPSSTVMKWFTLTLMYIDLYCYMLSYSWRHQMETFSVLLALCAQNSHVIDEFPSQRLVTRSFDVFFKRLSKQSRRWWFKAPSRSLWRHCDVYC